MCYSVDEVPSNQSMDLSIGPRELLSAVMNPPSATLPGEFPRDGGDSSLSPCSSAKNTSGATTNAASGSEDDDCDPPAKSSVSSSISGGGLEVEE